MMVDGGKGKNGLKLRDVIYSQDILTTMKAALCNHGLRYQPFYYHISDVTFTYD